MVWPGASCTFVQSGIPPLAVTAIVCSVCSSYSRWEGVHTCIHVGQYGTGQEAGLCLERGGKGLNPGVGTRVTYTLTLQDVGAYSARSL